MSEFTDAYQSQLARKRKIGVIIAGCIVVAATAIVLTFIYWPAPAPPKGADVQLTTVSNTAFDMGCPAGWKGRPSSGKLAMTTCTSTGGASCITVSEPLPKSISPATYWRSAKRLLGRARTAQAFSVDGRPLHRVIVSRSLSPSLLYIYTAGKTATVMTCSANLQTFDGLIPTFDAVGQSVVPKSG